MCLLALAESCESGNPHNHNDLSAQLVSVVAAISKNKVVPELAWRVRGNYRRASAKWAYGPRRTKKSAEVNTLIRTLLFLVKHTRKCKIHFGCMLNRFRWIISGDFDSIGLGGSVSAEPKCWCHQPACS